MTTDAVNASVNRGRVVDTQRDPTPQPALDDVCQRGHGVAARRALAAITASPILERPITPLAETRGPLPASESARTWEVTVLGFISDSGWSASNRS
jgi:hypothetical protein